jgi:hypothetical protein
MRTKYVAATAVVSALLLLTACGGGSETKTEVITATTGQQLTDLKEAYDAGALSEKEYEKERKKILKK